MADSIQNILVNEFIDIVIRPCDVNYYRSKGYEIPYEEKKITFHNFTIRTIDLPKYSVVKVMVRCTRCGKERLVSYRSYSITSGLCGVCAKQDCQKIMVSCNTGDNNKNWKGGVTPLHYFLRNTPEHKVWRLSVYERDLFTCKKCGCSGTNLNCHHIESFADLVETYNITKDNYKSYINFLFNVNNGITLCRTCHLDYHKNNGGMRQNKNILPFIEWLTNKTQDNGRLVS